jgi:nitrate/nitrite transport system permease protein
MSEVVQTTQWLCKVCNWVYDQADGDPDHGIPAGTAFADIPEDWYCPECGVTKLDFEPLAHSLVRVCLGFLLAVIVAIPLGFAIGMSPLLFQALNPFIQILKPISPLAWMPLALYSLKDSEISGIFVIFICSLWPMLINTAFGVAGVRRDWINVASTLEVRPLRKAFQVILPAAAPTILTGMRISMGIAWLVIVAAEMLVGGTGIGYFVWNEWNNLALPNVIFAVAMIGVVGMALDQAFGALQKLVTYKE